MSKLSKTLSRLFSSGVVVRRADDGKVKVVDTSRTQSVAGKFARNRYQGAYAGGTQTSGYNSSYGFLGSRAALFRDYESMDQDGIISAALDIYADECVTKDEYGDVLTVESEDKGVKEALNNLFYDILNIEANLRWWIRSLCKYGDYFMKLDISEGDGVINAQPLSAYDVGRVEGQNPQDPYEVSFSYEGEGVGEFEFWEIAHFRLLGDGNFLPYGKSLLEGARMTWKELTMMEDAMLIHRIMRAPERRVFKIDVGNIEPEAVDTFMNQIMSELKKTPLVDPQTGEYDLRYNLHNMMEDYYLPVRGDRSGTEIQTLNGLQFNGIEDIEYLRRKMMSALRVPNAFLGYERDIEGKATLAQESIKFANMVNMIQQVVQSELTKIAMIHLVSQGITDERMVNFKLTLTHPSPFVEEQKIRILESKFSLARTVTDLPMFSTDWIYRNIFNLNAEEIEEQRRLKVNDWKRQFRREQLEREGNDPVVTGQSFGTPADLAVANSQGSVSNKELNMALDDAEDFEEFERGYSLAPDSPEDPAKQSSTDYVTSRGDVTHNYQGGSPLAAWYKKELPKGVWNDPDIQDGYDLITEREEPVKQEEDFEGYMSEDILFEDLP
jgi:hypothetical protein